MYFYVEENGKGGKPASHPKNITRKTIKHGEYKNELFNKQQIYHKMKAIRSTSANFRFKESDNHGLGSVFIYVSYVGPEADHSITESYMKNVKR